jgi:hypothetical protein
MNRKFVKENKTLVKEFLGNLIASILRGKMEKNISKKLKTDKGFAKDVQQIKNLRKDIKKRIDNVQKTDPEFYKVLQQKYSR